VTYRSPTVGRATGNPGAVSDSAATAGGLGTTLMGLVLTELLAMRFLEAALVRESLAGLDRPGCRWLSRKRLVTA